MPSTRPTSPQLAPARRSRRTCPTIVASAAASRSRSWSRSAARRVSSTHSRVRRGRRAGVGAFIAEGAAGLEVGDRVGAVDGGPCPGRGGSSAAVSSQETQSAGPAAGAVRPEARPARDRRPLPIACLRSTDCPHRPAMHRQPKLPDLRRRRQLERDQAVRPARRSTPHARPPEVRSTASTHGSNIPAKAAAATVGRMSSSFATTGLVWWMHNTSGTTANAAAVDRPEPLREDARSRCASGSIGSASLASAMPSGWSLNCDDRNQTLDARRN